MADVAPSPHQWRNDAACRDADATLFFAPERKQGGSPGGAWADPAKEICAVCPVKATCLAWALEHPEEHGVWGGTTDRERVRIRKGLRLAGQLPPLCCAWCGRTFQPDRTRKVTCRQTCAWAWRAAQQRRSRERRAG